MNNKYLKCSTSIMSIGTAVHIDPYSGIVTELPFDLNESDLDTTAPIVQDYPESQTFQRVQPISLTPFTVSGAAATTIVTPGSNINQIFDKYNTTQIALGKQNNFSTYVSNYWVPTLSLGEYVGLYLINFKVTLSGTISSSTLFQLGIVDSTGTSHGVSAFALDPASTNKTFVHNNVVYLPPYTGTANTLGFAGTIYSNNSVTVSNWLFNFIKIA